MEASDRKTSIEENSFRNRKTKDQERRAQQSKNGTPITSPEKAMIIPPSIETSNSNPASLETSSKFSLSNTRKLLNAAKINMLKSRISTRKNQGKDISSLTMPSFKGNGIVFTLNLENLCGYGFDYQDKKQNSINSSGGNGMQYYAIVGRNEEKKCHLSFIPCSDPSNYSNECQSMQMTLIYDSERGKLNGYIKNNKNNDWNEISFEKLLKSKKSFESNLLNASMAVGNELFQARLSLSSAMEIDSKEDITYHKLDELTCAIRWLVEYTQVSMFPLDILSLDTFTISDSSSLSSATSHEKSGTMNQTQKLLNDIDQSQSNGDSFLISAARVKLKEMTEFLIPEPNTDISSSIKNIEIKSNLKEISDWREKRVLLQLKPFILSRVYEKSMEDGEEEGAAATTTVATTTTTAATLQQHEESISLTSLTSNVTQNSRLNRTYVTDTWRPETSLSTWKDSQGFLKIKQIDTLILSSRNNGSHENNDDSNNNNDDLVVVDSMTLLEKEINHLKLVSEKLINNSESFRIQANEYFQGWIEPIEKFEVRGLTYLKDGIKIISNKPFLPLLGVEMFHSPKKPRSPRLLNRLSPRSHRNTKRNHTNSSSAAAASSVSGGGGSRTNMNENVPWKRAHRDIGSHPACLLQKLLNGDIVSTEGSCNREVTIKYLKRLILKKELKQSKLNKKTKHNTNVVTAVNTDENIVNEEEEEDPSVIIFNFLLPFGNLIFYFLLPESLDDDSTDNSTDNSTEDERAAEEREIKSSDINYKKVCTHLVRDFVRKDDDYRNTRLKMLTRVEEGPWLVRSAIRKKKPVKLGEHLEVAYTKTELFLEVNIDVTRNRLGNHIASSVKPFLGNVVMDFGFVLEGQTSEELPENILGAGRVIKAKLDDTPYLPSSTSSYLETSKPSSPYSTSSPTSFHSKSYIKNQSPRYTTSPRNTSSINSDNGNDGQSIKKEQVLTSLDLSNMNVCLHAQDVSDLLLQLVSPQTINLSNNHRLAGQLPELDMDSFHDIDDIKRWLVVLTSFQSKIIQEQTEKMVKNKNEEEDIKDEGTNAMLEQYTRDIEMLTMKLEQLTTQTNKGFFFNTHTNNDDSHSKGKTIYVKVDSDSSTSQNNKNIECLNNGKNNSNESNMALNTPTLPTTTTTQKIKEKSNEMVEDVNKSLSSRLQNALPLPVECLPGIHMLNNNEENSLSVKNVKVDTDNSFVKSYQLVGIGMSEELGSEDDKQSGGGGGTEVMVNSEGSVFFLFFQQMDESNLKMKDIDEKQEFVFVLKFSGTDVRSRSEAFANQIAYSFGIAIPPLNMIVKGNKLWNNLESNLQHLKASYGDLDPQVQNIDKLFISLKMTQVALCHQFVQGCSLLECYKQLSLSSSSSSSACDLAKQLGICFLNDLLLRNSDRFRCNLLMWRGNHANMILSKSTKSINNNDNDGDELNWCLTAIDTTCPRAPPISATKTDADNYKKILSIILNSKNKEDEQDIYGNLLYELSFDGFGYSTLNDKTIENDKQSRYEIMDHFRQGLSEGIEKLNKIELFLLDIQEKVRKLMAGVTKTASKLLSEQKEEISKDTASIPTTPSDTTSSIKDNSSNIPPLPSPPSIKNASSRNASPSIRRPPPPRTSSRTIEKPTLRPKPNKRSSSAPPNSNGGTKGSPLNAVREIGSRYDAGQCTEREKEYVATWTEKIAAVGLEIDESLKTLCIENKTSYASNSFIFNGFLDGIIIKDIESKEGNKCLDCVELTFELHTRLKHLVPRAKLIRSIAEELA